MTNLLILSSHSILEYDDLRLFSRLGYDVFMPGGYADPRQGNDMRPAVPEAPYHPDLAALVIEQRERHAGESDAWPIIDWGKADLHPGLIDWADVIMVNCFPESWIGGQWQRIREKRVVWRTIGQSDPRGEQNMAGLVKQGVQVVRYSPAEKRAFEPLGVFAGEDAMIRFGKDPADYGPWIGDGKFTYDEKWERGPDQYEAPLRITLDGPWVGNLAQHGKIPHERDAFLNWPFVEQATADLPFYPAGPHSDMIDGGLGALTYDEMRGYLAACRVMLYTGTQPASYTLGLMEAMLTGTPVVSIGPEHMWLPALFEGHELATDGGQHLNDPAVAHRILARYLDDDRLARVASTLTRDAGLRLFSYDVVGPQWLDFLGAPRPRETARSAPREAVAA